LSFKFASFDQPAGVGAIRAWTCEVAWF